MRQTFPPVLLLLFALSGCADSHGSLPDGGASDAASDAPRLDVGSMGCDGRPPECVRSCGDTELIPAFCEDSAWMCPLGTVDLATCCAGDPRPGCVCIAGEWNCDTSCPDGINPWDPSDPANACRAEGATCSEGSQCGSAMFCQCEGGAWNCAIAEPDPVCTCGREPTAGDPCVEEGASCGECCPTPGSWEPMMCVGGRWEPIACPDIECPPVLERECPVYTPEIIGTLCPAPGQRCGNACCGTAFDCGDDSRWQPGPEADCLCAPGVACGDGTCPHYQLCHQSCGPDDGPIYGCATGPADGCADCSCIDLGPGQGCEMRDGVPLLYDFCG